MTYLLKSKRQHTPGPKSFWIVVFSVVCIFIIFSVLGYMPISRVLITVGSPFWSISAAVTESLSSVVSLVRSKNDLIENQYILETRLGAVTQDVSMITILRDENASLKEILGRSSFKRTLISTVLSNPARTPYDTLVIDVGKKFGVVSEARVSVGGIVVGSISEVTPTWSRVRLFSSPGEEYPVIIGKTRVTSLASGLGAGNFDAKLPRELDVVSGDTVIFPEFDKQILGVVESVELTPNDSFQRILFKSPINLAEIRFVEVELDSNR